MQKCASPQRTPHATPLNFPGGFYSQAVRYCTCSGFLCSHQQEPMRACLWAHEVALEQPLRLALVVLALTCMHTFTQGESCGQPSSPACFGLLEYCHRGRAAHPAACSESRRRSCHLAFKYQLCASGLLFDCFAPLVVVCRRGIIFWFL